MKLISYLFIFILISNYSQAQQKTQKADIKWGQEQKDAKYTTLSDIVGYDNDGFFAIRTKPAANHWVSGKTYLAHYDNNQNQTKVVQIEFKDKRKYEFTLQLKRNIFVFSSMQDSKTKKNTLFVQPVNKSTLLPENTPVKIAEIDFTGKSRRNSGSFDYVFSSDSTKLMIFYNLPYEKKEHEKFGFHMFDDNLTQLWQKEIVLPYSDELFEVEDYKVDQLGNVHLLSKIYKEKKKDAVKGQPNYKFQILSYYNNATDLKEFPVEIEGKFLTDMQIGVNKDQDIICAGFYSGVGTTGIAGCYFLKISTKTKELVTKNFKEFGLDFITQYMSEKDEKKTQKKAEKGKDVELDNYDLHELIMRDDGGIYLVGEQYYTHTSTYTVSDGKGGFSERTVTSYIYKDIIVLNISSNGEILWSSKIPKRQMSTNDGGFFASYALSKVNNNLYFVFNDNPNNLFYKGVGKIHNYDKSSKSIVVLVEMKEDGTHTREALFTSKDTETMTRPKVCRQVSGNEMIIYGQFKKTNKFAKLTFIPQLN